MNIKVQQKYSEDDEYALSIIMVTVYIVPSTVMHDYYFS